MYQIKRGDEVVLSEVDIDMAAEIILEQGCDKFNKLDRSHFELAYNYIHFVQDHESENDEFKEIEVLEVFNSNIVPIAAKYGLTIEEVKE